MRKRCAAGATISEGRIEIETALAEGCSRRRSAPSVTLTELRDGIPTTSGIVSLLCGTTRRLRQSAREAWSRVASEHGVTRVRIGFDIGHSSTIRGSRTSSGTSRLSTASTWQAAILADVSDCRDQRGGASLRRGARSRSATKAAEHIGFLTHELRNPWVPHTHGIAARRRSPANTVDVRQARAQPPASHDLIDNVLLTEKLRRKSRESAV